MTLISRLSAAVAVVAWLALAGVTIAFLDISWPVRLLLLGGLLVLGGPKPVAAVGDAPATCFESRRERGDMLSSVEPSAHAAVRPGGHIPCGALMFTPDCVAQFAGRLHVPIRGDFSVRVKDRVPNAG